MQRKAPLVPERRRGEARRVDDLGHVASERLRRDRLSERVAGEDVGARERLQKNHRGEFILRLQLGLGARGQGTACSTAATSGAEACWTAQWSGELPDSLASSAAPAAASCCTTATCPLAQARCSAVLPRVGDRYGSGAGSGSG